VLASRYGTSNNLFAAYPLAVPQEMRPGYVSYLPAFWRATCGYLDRQSNQRVRKRVWEAHQKEISFILWNISQADGAPSTLLEGMPEDIGDVARGWDAQRDEYGDRFDELVCYCIEGQLKHVDLLLTERGFFGITDDLGGEETQGLVVAKLAGLEHLLLLREFSGGDETYYEYVDHVEITHMGLPLEKLPGLKEQRIEIR